MLDKLLRYSYYTLFFLTPLLMYPYTSEIFEFNKIIFIYFMTSVITCAWIAKMIGQNKLLIRTSILDLPIGLLLISFVLSTVFSIDAHTSLWGYYGRFNGGLVSIICYILLYYALISNITSEYIYKLLKVSIVSSILVMVWALPGKFGYDMSCYAFTGQLNNSCWTDQFRPSERIFSTLGQPNWLGAYLAVHFFIGLYFFLREKKSNKYDLLWLGYMILNFICILFTRSRSSLIAVIISGGILIIYILIKQDFFRRKLKHILILAIVMLGAVLIFKSGIESIDKYLRLENYIHTSTTPAVPQPDASVPLIERYDVTESLDIRKIVWTGAMELGSRYPLFGTGLETFAYSYYLVRPQSHNLTSEWDYLYNKAHNEYLNYLATTGYIGLIVYMLFICIVLYICTNMLITKEIDNDEDKRLLVFCLTMSFVTALITNFFGFSTSTISLFFYLIPAMAQALLIHENKSAYEFFSLKQKFGAAASIASLLLISSQIFLYWSADTLYKKGDDLYRTGEYNASAYYLNQALKMRQEHVYEDKLSYVAANLALLLASEKKMDNAKNVMSVAEVYNKKSLQGSPQNVLYWKTRAKNMYLFYQIHQDKQYIMSGLSALDEAVKLSPTDPKISYTAAIFYSLLYDIEEQKPSYKTQSLAEIDKSINLKPNYRDSYFLKAQLLHKFGMNKEARETIQYILTKINPKDQEAKDLLKELK